MDRDFKKRDGDGHVVDLLSAYIDNALDPGETDQVRAHLESCQACGVEHEGLVGTQFMLRNLPVMPPPRAFTLTAEMAGRSTEARESFWQRLFTPRTAPRFAMGSVVAFALMFFLIVGNLTGSPLSGLTTADAPSATTAMQEAPVGQNSDTEAMKAPATTGAATGGASAFDVQATAGAGAAGMVADATPAPELSAEENTRTSAAPPPADNAERNPTITGTQDSYNGERPADFTLPSLVLALGSTGVALAVAALVARRRGA